MFESLKGMAGLAGVMKDLPRIKAKLAEVKDRLRDMTVEGEAGGGAVRVTATGELTIRSVRINPSLLAGLVEASAAQDRTLAENLISQAANSALEKAREMIRQEMTRAARELDLPIPPGAFSEGLGGLLS
jgi:DNA-binding YbaB/EbfC family protein